MTIVFSHETHFYIISKWELLFLNDMFFGSQLYPIYSNYPVLLFDRDTPCLRTCHSVAWIDPMILKATRLLQATSPRPRL